MWGGIGDGAGVVGATTNYYYYYYYYYYYRAGSDSTLCV